MVKARPGRSACHKLECLAEYIGAYASDLKNGGCYLELFAGAGLYNCPVADCRADGIELRVLKTAAGFSHFILVSPNQANSQSLQELIEPLKKGQSVSLITGNPIHETTMRQVFDLIPRSTASFALIDPPGYTSLRWTMIKKLASHGADWTGRKMDLLIILPLEMSILRNLARPACERSLNRLYGNDAWKETREKLTSGKMSTDKIRTELIELFKAGLRTLGYNHVEDATPARFSNPPYYHVIWASDRASRVKELRSVWGRGRFLQCEMFH